MTLLKWLGPSNFASTSSFDRALASRIPREVVADPEVRYFGAKLAERTLVPGAGVRLGETRFGGWLGHLVTQK